MRITKVSDNYYLHVRRGGKSMRISLHTNNRRTAEKHALQVINLLNKEKSKKIFASQIIQYAVSLAKGDISRKNVSCAIDALKKQAEMEAMEVISQMISDAPMTKEDMWQRYMESVDTSVVKQVTINGKKSKLDVFSKWLGDVDYKAVNIDTAKQFLEHLNCSNQTRNNYISDLSTIWQASGISNPWVSSLRRHADHEESKPVDILQLQALVKWCDSHTATASGVDTATWSRFIKALYYSGLRPVDVALLTFSECIEGHIELTPTKTSRTRRKVSYIPDKRFFDCLICNIAPIPSGYVFPGIAALYKHNRSDLSTAFRTLTRMAGITGMSLYQIRHYWVTHQMNSGINVEDVAAAVGHSSVSTTEGHYYHGKHDIHVSDMPEL